MRFWILDSGFWIVGGTRGRTRLSDFRNPQSAIQNPKSSFTLVELLVVIMILGILFGLITSAALRSLRAARRRRAESECVTLAAGIRGYYHQFGRWPVDDPYAAGLQTYSNNNFRVLRHMATNALGKSFLSLGDYRLDALSNAVTPWGECYIFVFNPTDHAMRYVVPGQTNDVGAESVDVTYTGSPR